jgi:nitronate monooxygenase
MIKTRITEMLGIEYPIIQGGMQWLACAELASAVSNAGGLGIVTALSFLSLDEIRQEIRRMRDMTDKPFGLNISMLPIFIPGEMTSRIVDLLIEEQVPVVETAGRSPEEFAHRLKEGGVKLIHKVPAVRFAQKAERIGADAVTVVGFECAGHPGMDDVPSLILVPKAAESVSIPVIAAGGFCDGKGLVAALAMGAEAILMGTRFMASKEAPMHENCKKWMLGATERDTRIVERSIRNPCRVIINEASDKVVELEARGTTLEELLPIISGKGGRAAYQSGDLNAGIIACGQVVGRIHEIKSCAEIIQDIVQEAQSITGRLGGLFQQGN